MSSSPRLVFLDIDGTYAFHGAVPPAHQDAVRQARANGHQVFLCTGRPRSTVSERLLAAGFDGVVAGAGAYAELHGTVLRDEVFPPQIAHRAIAALAAHQAISLVEATEAMYVLPEGADAMDARAPSPGRSAVQAAVWEDLIAARRVVSSFAGLRFAKVVTLRANEDLSAIASIIGPEVAAVETSIKDLGRGAGELYLAHITKEVGMRAVVEAAGATSADVVAAGDGPNDIEMMNYASVAIGIEGGHPEVLAAADVVVPGPEQSGLVEGFRAAGLI